MDATQQEVDTGNAGKQSADSHEPVKAGAKLDATEEADRATAEAADPAKANGGKASKSGDADGAKPAGYPQDKSAPPQEAKLDPRTEKLVDARVEARFKEELEPLLDRRMEPLLEVNRKLALFLGEQMQAVIELRQSVRAMERLVEGDARRKGKYAATLEAVRSEGEGMGDGVPDPHWINRTRGMLAQLERTGTLGPKPVDTMKQG